MASRRRQEASRFAASSRAAGMHVWLLYDNKQYGFLWLLLPLTAP
jgi:hypothetical protein